MNATDIKAGDTIPEFRRDGTLQHWNRFAAVNYEFAGHHMDDEVGRHEGFEAAIGMAPLILSYLHAMLRNWSGDGGRLAAVDMQLRAPFLRGRTLIASGRVKERREKDAEVLIDLEIWADDDQGKRLVNGSATVAFPA
jgi:acyl dehydratase